MLVLKNNFPYTYYGIRVTEFYKTNGPFGIRIELHLDFENASALDIIEWMHNHYLAIEHLGTFYDISGFHKNPEGRYVTLYFE